MEDIVGRWCEVLNPRRVGKYAKAFASPPLPTMRAAPASTEFRLFESLLRRTTRRRMGIFRPRQTVAGRRIVILRAEFLSTPPTPGATAPHTHVEFIAEIHPTRKNVVARRVFQTPAGTPRTLFGVFRARLTGHYNTCMENMAMNPHA